MKKREVIRQLFKLNTIPVYSHAITGEHYPYDDRWNRLYKNDKSTRIKIEKSFANNPRRLTDDEEEKLLMTGWNIIGTFDFYPENFRIE